MKQRTFYQDFELGLAIVGLIWLGFLVDFAWAFKLGEWGIQPRTLRGLVGIVAAPFLHLGVVHLIGNTVPLAVLTTLLAGTRVPMVRVITAIVLISGSLLWIGGRLANHIGASSLIFGLIAFLIFHGFFARRPLSILISIVVGMLYGSTLVFGVVPRDNPAVSWEGHLFGAIAGIIVAYWVSRGAAVRKASVETDPTIPAKTDRNRSVR